MVEPLGPTYEQTFSGVFGDREVSEELGGEIDLRFMGTGSGSSTPSPSKMMDLLALKTPVKNVQPEFQRPGPSSATKRPPPPTPRTPSKKQRSDDLVVELMKEQLKYYRKQNEEPNHQIDRRQSSEELEARTTELELRMNSIERVIGVPPPSYEESIYRSP